MSNIKSFPFNKENFDQIKNYNFGRNWPVVYLLEDKKEIYIGQTINAYYRSKQHYENPERRKLKEIHIITDEEFNVSATLDIESWLIQYISADDKYKLQNGNGGLKNHNYYDRVKYRTKFEITWEKLQKAGITENNLLDLENSDLFKYSPYKSLTTDQVNIVRKIYKELLKKDNKTFVVNGSAGTGKTILATYLLKFLKEQEKTKDLKIGLVLPMSAIRSTIKKVISKIKGLKGSMVIGPSDVFSGDYDLLIVDESHRLHRPKNITNIGAHYKNNLKLGLNQKEGTELDWIMRNSKNQIFFYDSEQRVHPSCIKPEDFSKLKAESFSLEEQMRVEAGEDYIRFIKDVFDLKEVKIKNFKNYELKIFNNFKDMLDKVKEKDSKHGLSRVISGYGWPWHTKKGTKDFDIELDGIRLAWNSQLKDWINSKNAINEVGCIHTVQGYGLNYVGVIIGEELFFDPKDRKIKINKKKYFDLNGKKGITDDQELEFYIKNIYKTLLTRGIKGTYIYIVDENLRNYFKEKLGEKIVSNIILPEKKVVSPYVKEMVGIPLVGSAPCGEPLLGESNTEEIIMVDKSKIKPGAKYFILRASGDSMDKAGIHDGDLVLCRFGEKGETGDRVAVLLGGDNVTIKYYDKKDGRRILLPKSTNPSHQPIIPEEGDSVQGIVQEVIKNIDQE